VACALDDPKLWASLPVALSLLWKEPQWGQASLHINDDMLGANLHCLVYGVHALLAMAEPHMPRTDAEVRAGTPVAYCRFLEASAAILSNMRKGMLEGKPDEVAARQRTHATIALLLEQLVQIAEPLGYNDLQRYLPRSIVLASYATIAQPIEIVNAVADDSAASLPPTDLRTGSARFSASRLSAS